MYRYIPLALTLVAMLPLSVSALSSGDRLDLTITPIRTELQVDPAKSVTGSVTLTNNSDQPYSFYMSAEDCNPTSDYRAPVCTPTQSGQDIVITLSKWIKFSQTGNFTIAPKKSQTVDYRISPPVNAIPGGHYGAIFFNNPDSKSTGTVTMNRRIGSLLLVTVSGNISVSPRFGLISVSDSMSGSGADMPWGPIMRPPTLSELLASSLSFSSAEDIPSQLVKKGHLLLDGLSQPTVQSEIIDFINPFWSRPDDRAIEQPGSGTVEFNLPIDNSGTVHIQPGGIITLHELDDTQLTQINKEIVKDENGVVLGEKVVDYITINDGEGNVLPNTHRNFTVTWNGFVKQVLGSDGRINMGYESPSEYYSRLADNTNGTLYPWEKISRQRSIKHLKAHINLSYIDPVTKQKVTNNSKADVKVEYIALQKGLNTGLIFWIVILLLIYLLARRRKNNASAITSLQETKKKLSIKKRSISPVAKKDFEAIQVEQKYTEAELEAIRTAKLLVAEKKKRARAKIPTETPIRKTTKRAAKTPSIPAKPTVTKKVSTPKSRKKELPK